MSLFSGDNEIGNILQQAVKLKSAQMNEKRKTYETRPFFVQHTLFHGEKEDFKAWRQLPFDEKKVISERLKEEGNDLFKKGSWMDAVEKYEEAASLVHYYWSTDANWRKNNRGIDDDVLKLVDDLGGTEEDARWQRKHRALCALNLAACKQKLDKFDEAIIACDVTLELDPDNVKALYRRAESRIRPTKATAYDHDIAIKDLAKANALDPSNQTVERLLVRLRGERRVQREKDAKTYTGLFDRGQIYDKVAQEARLAKASTKTGGSLLASGATYEDLEQRISEISDQDPIEKRIQDAELLRDLYVRNGKEDEARQLNDQIKQAKKVVKDNVEQPKIDWSNPPPELVEDAKKHGLDLTDPVVLQELKRMEREGFDKTANEEPSGPSHAQCPAEEEEEEDSAEPIPWKRYFVFFAVVYVFWCLVDVAILNLAPKRPRPRPPPPPPPPPARPISVEGHARADEPVLEEAVTEETEADAHPPEFRELDEEEEAPARPSPGYFASVYEAIAPWILGEADETEL
ncbi:FKBP70 [Symbiodinium natans]|uniref:FKBP70 protein n=1 Tax=Symbiodinium natans TaxID=878477 RepID=A0A812SK15_9DINO|nr:FKBP70 [Symbiodinium natans]